MKTRVITLAALLYCLVLLATVGFADNGSKVPPKKASAIDEKLKEPAKKQQPKQADKVTSKVSDKKDQPAPVIIPSEPQLTPVQPVPEIKPIEKQPQVEQAPGAEEKGRMIKWQVISSGGTDNATKVSSSYYQISHTVCQTAVGYTSSSSYQASQGYWHGIGGGGAVLCGDANANGMVEAGDVVYLISYLFRGGPEPEPLCKGDVNLSGAVEAGDVVYLISYLFRAGPEPSPECCG